MPPGTYTQNQRLIRMEDQQKQLVERLKESQNILVTVSKDPTVDQLSAAIALTIALNKLEKHGTAVFSGRIPNTLEFLRPEETLEKNTDSLRDFIIALDKSKADKLRYKVEDTVVRIFITPYKTSITDHDLDFSQGDFNVDVVVALGVTDQQDIDEAIPAHGRILHDAVVTSISDQNPPDGQSGLGSINWVDATMSSLSEMIASMIQQLEPTILDGQIATALLTGIVASTDRFSNDRTTPKTMNTSASLMAAGANQQLIAAQLAAPANTQAPQESDVSMDGAAESNAIEIKHKLENSPQSTDAPENTSNSTATQEVASGNGSDGLRPLTDDTLRQSGSTDNAQDNQSIPVTDMKLPEVAAEVNIQSHTLLPTATDQFNSVAPDETISNTDDHAVASINGTTDGVPDVSLMTHNEDVMPNDDVSHSVDSDKPVVVDLTTVPGPSAVPTEFTDSELSEPPATPPHAMPELKLPEFEPLASEPPARPVHDFLAGTDTGVPVEQSKSLEATDDTTSSIRPSDGGVMPVDDARNAVASAFNEAPNTDNAAPEVLMRTPDMPPVPPTPLQQDVSSDNAQPLQSVAPVLPPQSLETYQPAPGFPVAATDSKTPTNPGFNEPSPGSSPADATLDMPMPYNSGTPDGQHVVTGTFPELPSAGTQPDDPNAPPPLPPPIMPPVH